MCHPLNPLTTLVSMLCYSGWGNWCSKGYATCPRSIFGWCETGSFWPPKLFLNPAPNQLWGEQNLDKATQEHKDGASGFLGNEWTCGKDRCWRPSLRMDLTAFHNPPPGTGSANTQPWWTAQPLTGSQSGHARPYWRWLRSTWWELIWGPRRTWGPPPHLSSPPCTPTHFHSPFASTPALSHNLYASTSDPQESGPDLRHHALVSGHIFPEDAVGTSETQLRHAH